MLQERMFDFTKQSLSWVVTSKVNWALIVDYYEGLLCEKVGDACHKIQFKHQSGETAPSIRFFMIGLMKK